MIKEYKSRSLVFFSSRENIGKSKGLLVLAKELNIPLQSSIKLDDLRETLAKHAAFQQVPMALLLKDSIFWILSFSADETRKACVCLQCEDSIRPEIPL